MPNTMRDVATKFVDLALKYKRWDEIKTLPTDEVQILFNTVVIAGFNPQEVTVGSLMGHYREQDGSHTGETYPINSLCPFKVVGQKSDNHYFATGWLDCALRRVILGTRNQNESRERLIEVIVEEIERSIPLEPIQLTPEGDFLREYPPSKCAFGLQYFVMHTCDENNLGSSVGVHMYCNGWMDRREATDTHDAIVCRECHLRVLFSKEVKTYGDLRHILASRQIAIPA